MKNSRKLLLDALTVAVTLLALAFGGFRGWQYLFPGSSYEVKKIDGAAAYGAAGERVGAENPSVTIIEWADYTCPYCQRAAADIEDLLQEFPREVALVFRHYPLAAEGVGNEAARAAECAAELGEFERFHGTLFAEAQLLGTKPWVELAEQSGIDTPDEFMNCLSEVRVDQAIERDIAAANDLGIRGTPMFLVNDLQIHGYPGSKEFRRRVIEAVRKGRGD